MKHFSSSSSAASYQISRAVSKVLKKHTPRVGLLHRCCWIAVVPSLVWGMTRRTIKPFALHLKRNWFNRGTIMIQSELNAMMENTSERANRDSMFTYFYAVSKPYIHPRHVSAHQPFQSLLSSCCLQEDVEISCLNYLTGKMELDEGEKDSEVQDSIPIFTFIRGKNSVWIFHVQIICQTQALLLLLRESIGERCKFD